MREFSRATLAENILQWDETRVVDYLRRCRHDDDGEIDLSNVAGVHYLPDSEKEQFELKMRSALNRLEAFPIDADELVRRLQEIPAPEDRHRVFEASNIEGFSRSSTITPPLNNVAHEELCFTELIKTQGIPALSPETITDPEHKAELDRQLAMWVVEEYDSVQSGDLPPLFSSQLDDWMRFRQNWQWDNRGKHTLEEGFEERVAWRVKHLRSLGERKDGPDNPEWLAREKEMWTRYRVKVQIEGRVGQDFNAYSSALQKRLAEHHIFEPIRLLEKPREQDFRTTWAEYLCYLYYSQDRYADALAKLEDEYKHARANIGRATRLWEEQEEAALSRPTDDMIRRKTRVVKDFIKVIDKYWETKRIWARQKRRAAWARTRFSAMVMMEQEAATEDAAAVGPATVQEKLKTGGKRKRGGTAEKETEKGKEKMGENDKKEEKEEKEEKPAVKRAKLGPTQAAGNKAESVGPRRSTRVAEAINKKAAQSGKQASKGKDKTAGKHRAKETGKGKEKEESKPKGKSKRKGRK